MTVDDTHSHETPEGFEALRSRGLRLTRQRQLIWHALAEDEDAHLGADEVLARVQAHMPDVDASTVYRTLDLLVREGLVVRTDLGGDRAYFEPAREHLHHHVVCERCGKVTHLHEAALGDLRARIEAASGYTLSTGELSFFGLCADCANSGASSK